MKNNFKLCVFIFVFFLCFFLPKSNATQPVGLIFPDPEATISMDFQDAGLKDILKIFSIQSGLNFIASEAVQDRKVTLYLDKVPIKEAMNKLFKANNLTYELYRDSDIFIVKDWGKPQIETVTKIFYLKYATVSTSSLKSEMSAQIGATGGGGGGGKWAQEGDSGLTKAIKKIVSEYGSVMEEYRTNSLIVTDIPSKMPLIIKTIAALDIPIPQVLIEVEMLDVSKNFIDKLGVNFSTATSFGNNPLTLILPGHFVRRGARFRIGRAANKDAEGAVSFNDTYMGFLDLLRKQIDTKYLARPRILTLNNETAEIKITTQETVGQISTISGTPSTTTTSAERIETGVSLRVTPQINIETGEITMFIMPVVRDATTSALFSSSYMDPEERSTKTTVRIKDGETVVLGGLLRHELSQTNEKVAILGDIPILGALFRHKDKTKDKERELLVFITPHIIKDTNIELAQAKKADLPVREQDTFSGLNRETAIKTGLNSFDRNK